MKKQDPSHYDLGSGKPVEGEEQTRCPFNPTIFKINDWQHVNMYVLLNMQFDYPMLMQEACSANGKNVGRTESGVGAGKESSGTSGIGNVWSFRAKKLTPPQSFSHPPNVDKNLCAQESAAKLV